MISKKYKNNSSGNHSIIALLWKLFCGFLRFLLPYINSFLVGFFILLVLFPSTIDYFPKSNFRNVFLIFKSILSLNLTMYIFSYEWIHYFCITIVVILFLFCTKFLPYRVCIKDNVYYQKKTFFPLYRSFSIIAVKSPLDSYFLKNDRYAKTIHHDFIEHLSKNLSKYNLLITKIQSNDGSIFGSDVPFFLVIPTTSFFRHNLIKKTEANLLFVKHSLKVFYDATSTVLTPDEIDWFFNFLNSYKHRTVFSPSYKETKIPNLTEHIYSLFINETIGDAQFLFHISKINEHDYYLCASCLTSNKETSTKIYETIGFKHKKNYHIPFNRIQNIQAFFSTAISKKTRFKISLNNLSNYIHIPNGYLGTIIKRKEFLSTSLTSEKDKIVLGNTTDNLSFPICLKKEDLLFNIEIYGMVGRGKTQLVSLILKQLISIDVNMLIFDIKGEYAREYVQNPNVEIYTIGRPNPLCVNVFETQDEDDVRSTLLILEEMLKTSNQDFSPAMKNLFETALFLTHKTKRRHLKTFIENLIDVTSNLRIQGNSNYVQQTLDAVLNRLNFIFNPINFDIFGVSRTTLDFTKFENGKTIILDFSEFQRRAARPSDIYLICNIILKMFYRYATSRGVTNKLRYLVVLEEAVNIIPRIYTNESSASLISSENNFLLGRNLGIGHITISQMWDSVSKIVHGNSSTKIIFRSSEKTDKIARALNIGEDEINNLHKLPIQHCYVFKDGFEKALELKTNNISTNSYNYSNYLSLLRRKYPSRQYPLLYENFIEMRTSLYKQVNKIQTFEKDKSSQSDHYPIERNKNENLSSVNRSIYHNQSTITIDQLYQDDICNQLCQLSNHSVHCYKGKYIAMMFVGELQKRYKDKELLNIVFNCDLFNSVTSHVEKNIGINIDQPIKFCIIQNLIFDLLKKTNLSENNAVQILRKYVE